MSRPLTKYDLDTGGCAEPGCTHDHSVLYLHPRCHRNRPTHVRYDKKQGHVIVACAQCGQEVARFAPAAEAVQ